MKIVHGIDIYGVDVDSETRCGHWHSLVDVIAIKFKCCGRWYPCFDCHSEIARHEASIWFRAEFEEKAILCGACGHRLSITEYLECENSCTQCAFAFNPACSNHYDLYFSTE